MNKIFVYHIAWRYSGDNFQEGLILAEDEVSAKEKLCQITNCLFCDIRLPDFDENDMDCIYDN